MPLWNTQRMTLHPQTASSTHCSVFCIVSRLLSGHVTTVFPQQCSLQQLNSFYCIDLEAARSLDSSGYYTYSQSKFRHDYSSWNNWKLLGLWCFYISFSIHTHRSKKKIQSRWSHDTFILSTCNTCDQNTKRELNFINSVYRLFVVCFILLVNRLLT